MERITMQGQRFKEGIRVTTAANKEWWHVFIRADAPPTAKGMIRASVKHATESVGDPAGGWRLWEYRRDEFVDHIQKKSSVRHS